MLCFFEKFQNNKNKDVESSEEDVIIPFINLWIEVKPVFHVDAFINKYTMLDIYMFTFNTCKQVKFSTSQYFRICKEHGKMTEKCACRKQTSM